MLLASDQPASGVFATTDNIAVQRCTFSLNMLQYASQYEQRGALLLSVQPMLPDMSFHWLHAKRRTE